MAVDRRRPRRAPAAAAAIASLLPPLLLVALLLVEAASAAPAPSQATTKPGSFLTKTTRAIKVNGVDVNLADVEAGRARLPPGVRVTSGAAARQAALASVGSKALLPPVPPACIPFFDASAFPPLATTGIDALLILNTALFFNSSLSPLCSTPLTFTSYQEYALQNDPEPGFSQQTSIIDPSPPGVGQVIYDLGAAKQLNLLIYPFPPSSRPLVAGAVTALALDATNSAASNALVSYYSGTAAWSFIFNGTAGVRSAAPLLNCNDGKEGVPFTTALDCGGGGVIKVTGATALKSAPLVCANRTFFGRTNTVLFAPQYPQGLFGLPVLGCVADVTALAAAACDGRTTCVITDAALAAAGFDATTCPPAAFADTGSQLTAAAYYTCVDSPTPPHNKKDHILAALAHLPFIKHNDNNKGRKLMLDAAAMP